MVCTQFHHILSQIKEESAELTVTRQNVKEHEYPKVASTSASLHLLYECAGLLGRYVRIYANIS